jgi:hypothetical protein
VLVECHGGRQLELVQSTPAAGVKTTTYGAPGSFACVTAGGQVGGNLLSREDASGVRVGQSLAQVAN